MVSSTPRIRLSLVATPTTLATALMLISLPSGVQAAAASLLSRTIAADKSFWDDSITSGLTAPRGPAETSATCVSEATPQLLSAALAGQEVDGERQFVVPDSLEARRTATLERDLDVDEDLYERIAADLLESRFLAERVPLA